LKYALLAMITIGVTLAATAQQVTVSVPVASGGKQEALLEAHVYGRAQTGRNPIVIISHGSSGGQPHQSIEWSEDASYFVQKGYVVIGFMRRGRGMSTGTSLESEEKNCNPGSWKNGVESALRDLNAVIEYAQALPGVDPTRITLVGMSRGGYLSIAYAAEGKHRNDISAAINFSGGWVAQAEDLCPIDFNEISFARYGARTTIRTLWLYGASDLFYGDARVRSYAATYNRAGGKGEFKLIPGVPENGHWLSAHRDLWRASVDAFLSPTVRPSNSLQRP
jgi:dienelactone hydrolase